LIPEKYSQLVLSCSDYLLNLGASLSQKGSFLRQHSSSQDKYPFGPTSSPQYSFSRFLLIQLGDVIPAWHRYPDLKPLAHLLKALKLEPLY
jgi:hypothetical protein